MIVLCLGALTASAIGLYLGVKRLARDIGRLTRSKRAADARFAGVESARD